MSKYHEEYSKRHKVEFRPDEFAEDPRTFADPAIRIICAPKTGTASVTNRRGTVRRTPCRTMPTCRSTSWTTVPCISA